MRSSRGAGGLRWWFGRSSVRGALVAVLADEAHDIEVTIELVGRVRLGDEARVLGQSEDDELSGAPSRSTSRPSGPCRIGTETGTTCCFSDGGASRGTRPPEEARSDDGGLKGPGDQHPSEDREDVFFTP